MDEQQSAPIRLGPTVKRSSTSPQILACAAAPCTKPLFGKMLTFKNARRPLRKQRTASRLSFD